MKETPSIEGLIELYEKQTFDGNTDPLPEPIDPRTQRLGLGDETLIISYALADALRESSMRLAPSVGEYDSKNVVSANDEKLASMDLEVVWKEPEVDRVAFLETMIRNKAITKWRLIEMLERKEINIRDPKERERLLKMVDVGSPNIRERKNVTTWPRWYHPSEPRDPWPAEILAVDEQRCAIELYALVHANVRFPTSIHKAN